MDYVEVDSEEESAQNYRMKCLVARHLLQKPSLFEGAFDIVQETSFFDGYPLLQIIVRAVEQSKMFHGPPTLEMLEADLADSSDLSEAQKKEGMELLTRWFSTSAAFNYNEEMVWTELKQARQVHVAQEVRSELEDEQRSVREIVQSAHRRFESEGFTAGLRESNPFSNPQKFLATRLYEPTGFTPIDICMDGGSEAGELVGFVIPSGGGKTTLGLQIAACQVERRNHVLYMQTEQQIEGDITMRAFCLATGMPRSEWKRGWNHASETARKRMDEVRDAWAEYFHVFSLKDDLPRTVDELFAPAWRLAEEGKTPKYIIFDWWGDLRDGFIEHLEKTGSDSESRRRSRVWMHDVKAQTGRLGDCRTIMFHQLAGAEAEKVRFKANSSHSAQEDKNFNNRMDFCFTFSNKDKDDRVIMRSDKARRAENKEINLVLDGEYCRLQHANEPERAQADAMRMDERDEEIVESTIKDDVAILNYDVMPEDEEELAVEFE